MDIFLFVRFAEEILGNDNYANELGSNTKTQNIFLLFIYNLMCREIVIETGFDLNHQHEQL